MTRVMEVRDPQGGRNFLRAGDPVRVTPGAAERRSWRGVFRWAELNEAGEVTAITVIGGAGFDPARPPTRQRAVVQWRTVSPARVSRLSRAHIARRSAEPAS